MSNTTKWIIGIIVVAVIAYAIYWNNKKKKMVLLQLPMQNIDLVNTPGSAT